MGTAASSKYDTLLDLAKSLDPNGAVAATIHVLAQQNEILDDIPVQEGNKADGHVHTIDAALPSITARRYNQGTAATKGSNTQVTDVITMLDAFAECDADLAGLSGNVPRYRVQKEQGFLLAMKKELARQLFYGNSATAPEETNGIAPRYGKLAAAAGAAAEGDNNVFDGGGSTASAQTSIYLAIWSPQTAWLIYPKGSQGGIEREDMGKGVLYDASGNPFMGYRTHYKWHAGLAVADWRSIVRIANIDIAALLTSGDAASTAANLLKLMGRALDNIPSDIDGAPVFYMNRKVRSMLRVQMDNKGNAALRAEDITGVNGITRRAGLTYHGVPCRIVEQIVNTEEVVTV